jgi:hypothetical protein
MPDAFGLKALSNRLEHFHEKSYNE